MGPVVRGIHRRSVLSVKDLRGSAVAGGSLLESRLAFRTTEADPDRITEREMTPPRWSLHHSVRIRSDLPALIAGRSLLAGPLLRESFGSAAGPLTKNAVLSGDPDRAKVRRTGRTHDLPEGIFLGGFAPRAYFHHLGERISRLALLDLLPSELQDLPILVPEETLRFESLVDASSLLAPAAQLVPLRWQDEYRVRRVVWMDEVHRWTAGYPGVITHVEAMNRYRMRILAGLGIEPRVEPGLRLYVSRGERRRSPAELELERVAIECGLETWRPEEMSFADQVSLWSRAESVAGESGAAWTGALFASEGSKGIVVTDGSASGWPHLGRISGMSVRVLRSYDPERFRTALAGH